MKPNTFRQIRNTHTQNNFKTSADRHKLYAVESISMNF